ncbi:MAG TPA: PA14 domain-containing protein [Polyangia bacterium]|nr:PA14 domain-containing protein [Polyangia bacterium]
MPTDSGGGGIGGLSPTGSGGTFSDALEEDLPGEPPVDPRKANGVMCGAATECASGFCVDGVCCENTCMGTCRTCALPGSAGTCRPFDVGTDPADECLDQTAASCGTDGTCDGAGGCRKYPEGTMCAVPGCSGSMLTMLGSCSAAGMCMKPAGTACGNYTCNGAACRTTCTLSAQCTTPSVCNTTTTSCGGLVGAYYNNTNFTGNPVMTRTDAIIDLDWGTTNPPGVNPDNFSIRWKGKVTPRFSQMYTFYLLADDGIRLMINNMMVIDSLPNPTPTVEKPGTPIMLQANQPVSIQIDFNEIVGSANIRLSWSSMSETKAVIPTSALSPP